MCRLSQISSRIRRHILRYEDPNPSGDHLSAVVCDACHNSGITPELDRCVHCGFDLGFPNVRAARATDEQNALVARYDAQLDSIPDKRVRETVLRFQRCVERESSVVVNKTAQALAEMLSSERDLFVPYYKLVEIDRRVPNLDDWNRWRPLVDQILFPQYYEEIRFASLTLDDLGVISYGPFTIHLDEELISARSSVFECNSIVFVRDKFAVFNANLQLPPGFRSTWEDRGKLAVAKYGSELAEDTDDEEFPRILLRNDDNESKDEFLEVHIWGPITEPAIKTVVLDRAARPTFDDIDEAYIVLIRELLLTKGISFVELAS
jgi:hypothetical protein